MTASRFHLSGFPRAMGFAVVLHVLAVLWMAASPAMHSAVHHDASEPEHSCSVTMFAAGNFHGPTLQADFVVRLELPLIARFAPLTERITAVRFSLGLLEHAPPATV